jgi:hypothetical protein
VRVDIIFEPSDQRLEFFMFLCVFRSWFFWHVYEVFDKICVS